MNIIAGQQGYDSAKSLAFRLRQARSARIKDQISKIYLAKGECRIIDLGGTAQYWRIFDRSFLEESRVSITLINHEAEAVDDPLFSSRAGDACALAYDDNSFDLAHSNSVIEHVGGWENRRAFANETKRVAPHYYVQTPYFWFPIEPHYAAPFIHWLPEPLRAQRFVKGPIGRYRKAETMDVAMKRIGQALLVDKVQFKLLFDDAEHHVERFAGLVKSLIAIR